MIEFTLKVLQKEKKAGSTGNCKISDLFEKFVFWS